MSTSAQPLFDMSKAQPISAPLFDMSKAQPIGGGSSSTVSVGGRPVNLITGEGADVAAQHQAEQVIGNQGEKMHGAISLMGHPASSIAQEKSFENALTSPVPSSENAPEGSKELAKAGEVLPSLASAATVAGPAGEAIGAGMELIRSALPSTKMAKAAKQFQELKGAIGGHTVAMTDELGDALTDIKQAVDTGSTLPSVINKFVTRIADTDQGPLTYAEARQFYHNVSELSVSERLATKPSDLRLINNFKYALGDTIADTTASAGKLQQYQGAMKGYAAGAQGQEKIQAAKDILTKKVIPTAIAGAGAGAAGALGYSVLRKTIENQ